MRCITEGLVPDNPFLLSRSLTLAFDGGDESKTREKGNFGNAYRGNRSRAFRYRARLCGSDRCRIDRPLSRLERLVYPGFQTRTPPHGADSTGNGVFHGPGRRAYAICYCIIFLGCRSWRRHYWCGMGIIYPCPIVANGFTYPSRACSRHDAMHTCPMDVSWLSCNRTQDNHRDDIFGCWMSHGYPSCGKRKMPSK